MSQCKVRSQYQGLNQREDEDQTMSQCKVRSQYHNPYYSGSNTTHQSQVNSKRMGNHYRTYNRTILPTPSQDQQAHVCVKIVQVFVKLIFLGKLLQKLVISDKCDFVVIDICTFDLDILTKVFLE